MLRVQQLPACCLSEGGDGDVTRGGLGYKPQQREDGKEMRRSQGMQRGARLIRKPRAEEGSLSDNRHQVRSRRKGRAGGRRSVQARATLSSVPLPVGLPCGHPHGGRSQEVRAVTVALHGLI